MGATYLTWLAEELRAAGVNVREVDGWQRRARRSGGYDDPSGPLGVMFHHTAASTPAENQAQYIITAPTAPIANVSIAPDGVVWLIAAGATNTNGKGVPIAFSRGTVPADRMNEFAFGMELMNDGVGQPYPRVQVDAALATSNAVNKRCGNRLDDVATHAAYAPGRKIDPARASAVEGPWRPRGAGPGDTWSLDDLRAECLRRGIAQPPPPIATPTRSPGMYLLGVKIPGAPGDGILGLRVGVDVLVHEVDGIAWGIDKWLGLPYSECGPADAAHLFARRRATTPSPVGPDAGPWRCDELHAAWRT